MFLFKLTLPTFQSTFLAKIVSIVDAWYHTPHITALLRNSVIHLHEIKQLIETHISESVAIITGEDGRHFTATVISDQFNHKNRIQKQQLVYSALGSLIHDGTIHAISIKTFTPDEWQQQETKHG